MTLGESNIKIDWTYLKLSGERDSFQRFRKMQNKMLIPRETETSEEMSGWVA
jgi:hypothetical protein